MSNCEKLPTKKVFNVPSVEEMRKIQSDHEKDLQTLELNRQMTFIKKATDEQVAEKMVAIILNQMGKKPNITENYTFYFHISQRINLDHAKIFTKTVVKSMFETAGWIVMVDATIKYYTVRRCVGYWTLPWIGQEYIVKSCNLCYDKNYLTVVITPADNSPV